MFKLMKNAHIYAPEDLGIKDMLLWEDRIIKIGEKGIDLKLLEIVND